MDDFDERLAEEVRKHRRLYDNACPSRKNSKATTATWRTIGGALAEEPALCMRRWKALRDKFVRLKKRIKAKPHPQGQGSGGSGGSGSELPGAAEVAVVGCHHVIHDKLSWLNDHVTHRSATIKKERSRRPTKRGDNHLGHDPSAGGVTVTDMDQSSEALPMSEAECDGDGELDGCKPSAATHHGRRKAATDNNAESAEDAYDRYTQTVADFMRGLSRRRCVVFKKRLNDLMYEMDLEELDDFAPS